MGRIESFNIDNDRHPIGFYLSGVSNGIYTYDMRMKTPNGGDYFDTSSLHTIEHLFSAAIRNGRNKEKAVYFGPMGCRTGCYLLLKDTEYDEALEIMLETLSKCLEFDDIPDSSIRECGNYLDHDLDRAKREIRRYLIALTGKRHARKYGVKNGRNILRAIRY